MKDEWTRLVTEKTLCWISGGLGGYMTFVYFWVFQLNDLTTAIFPAFLFGGLVYLIALVYYKDYVEPRLREYTDIHDELSPLYVNAVKALVDGKLKLATEHLNDMIAVISEEG